MAIQTQLVVYGINETEFVSIKPIVVDIVAGITNSSESTIDVQYLESGTLDHSATLTYLQYIPAYIHTYLVIEVTVRPADKIHSKYVLSKMEDSIFFLREINSGIQNQTSGSNLTVSYVIPPMSIPGLWIMLKYLKNVIAVLY